MTKTRDAYRMRAFARLAGVTIKALRHYERLGLLVPARTGAGHRLFTARDVERVGRIVALKALGFPLREVRVVLTAGTSALVAALKHRRVALEERLAATARALDVITRAALPLEAGDATPDEALQLLVEVTKMEQAIDRMKKYFDNASWPAARLYFEQWPSPAWRALLDDAQIALGSDPAGDRAGALAARWLALVEADGGGNPRLRSGIMTAWLYRDRWPQALLDRTPGLDLEAIGSLINEAAWSKVGAEAASPPPDAVPRVQPRVGATRLKLFADIAAALNADPTSATGRRLAARWRQIVEADCGGDEDIRAALLDAFARRKRLPRGMRRSIAATYEMDVETWERVTDFIEAAAAPQ